MNTRAIYVAAFFLTVATAAAQERPSVLWRQKAPAMEVTGNARIDFVGLMALRTEPMLEGDSTVPAERKSPWIAAGLSAILPGSGEFYAGNYYKSAAFFAVEIAAWVFAYSYDKKGDNQTSTFESFADQHWSVIRYGLYAQNNLNPPNPPYNWLAGNINGQPPWAQVNWSELNRMERDIGQAGGVGSYYSHVLPPHGDQQYYELIGKYEQFNQGWDDANPNLSPPDYSTIVANLSPSLTNYSGMRAKANTYYNNASTFVAVAIINHVISALDAAWTASSFNKSVHAEAGFLRVPHDNTMVDLPVLKVRVDI